MGFWASLRALPRDLAIAVGFLTRVPIRLPGQLGAAEFGRSMWAYGLVGALVGLASGLGFWLAHLAGLGPALAAVLALATSVLLTGALHEDGLADLADGFGGGTTREAKLMILRDSRIGTYGVLALGLGLLARWAALAALAEPALVLAVLVAAHALARGALPVVMHLLPPARREGLAASAGRPGLATAASAVLGAFAIALLALGPLGVLAATIATALAVTALGWLARRQIGGVTGDVLGAMEQAVEIAILLLSVALLSSKGLP